MIYEGEVSVVVVTQTSDRYSNLIIFLSDIPGRNPILLGWRGVR